MRLFLSVLVTALIVALASPAHAHSPSSCPSTTPPILQFVGATTATVAGHGHLLGWLPLCRAEYPGSQVCTTRDMVESAPILSMESGDTWWVMPYWIDSQHEYSGRFYNEVSCAAIQRFIFFGDPIFSSGDCTATHPVACCARP
jgi:hypothetical protein